MYKETKLFTSTLSEISVITFKVHNLLPSLNCIKVFNIAHYNYKKIAKAYTSEVRISELPMTDNSVILEITMMNYAS